MQDMLGKPTVTHILPVLVAISWTKWTDILKLNLGCQTAVFKSSGLPGVKASVVFSHTLSYTVCWKIYCFWSSLCWNPWLSIEARKPISLTKLIPFSHLLHSKPLLGLEDRDSTFHYRLSCLFNKEATEQWIGMGFGKKRTFRVNYGLPWSCR